MMRVNIAHARELKTAQEVREHARMVQRRINAQRRQPELEPPAPEPAPPPAPELPPEPDHEAELRRILEAPVRRIMRITANHHDLPLSDLLSERRTKELTIPRQIGFFVARRFGAPYPRIGRAVHRDHTTVLSGCMAIERRLLAGNQALLETINTIGEQAAESLGAQWRPIEECRVDVTDGTNEADHS